MKSLLQWLRAEASVLQKGVGTHGSNIALDPTDNFGTSSLQDVPDTR